MNLLKHQLKISVSSVIIGFVVLLSDVALAEKTVLGEESQLEQNENMEELIVSGQSDRPDFTNLLSQTLSGAELVHRRQGGIGETLAGLPGVHMDKQGILARPILSNKVNMVYLAIPTSMLSAILMERIYIVRATAVFVIHS
ncbi:hypothetical protein [Exilibacterium tricleocarpae]|uniref:hypothetical protein n=1 Tax=Exilibacterium tricleocarpae TaxID=2591008 RepID=UPI001C554662|nr:hypothetical protein [Exilibacterium tricleocarpae]